MPTPEEEAQEARKKRTVLLLAGGAASLILPLLGVVYIRVSESKTARAPNGSVMFDRRESGEEKINVTQTVTIIPPSAASPAESSLPVAGGVTMTPAPGSSSLDFVKGGENSYFPDKKAPAVAPSTPAVSGPIVAEEPEPEPKVAAKKGGKKTFVMPKLQGTKSFSSFKGTSPKPTGGKGVAGVAAPAGKGDGDIAEMLKNVPGGVNNPEVQKFLKSQGK